jgi:hemerythrin-like domain-containing protein
MAHHEKEERHLFPLLEVKLRESGEHGTDDEQLTGVTVMHDDHVEVLQLAAVIFNLFGMASRLPDEESRGIVMETVLKQSEALVELIRLHIYREDNVIFPLAQKLLEPAELSALPA